MPKQIKKFEEIGYLIINIYLYYIFINKYILFIHLFNLI
jgi:hypothetical protein